MSLGMFWLCGPCSRRSRRVAGGDNVLCIMEAAESLDYCHNLQAGRTGLRRRPRGRSGRHIPDPKAILADRAIRAELAHARHVQNALAGPRSRVDPERVHLRMAINITL